MVRAPETDRPKKIARNPASSRSESHWNERNSCPAILNDKYNTYSASRTQRSHLRSPPTNRTPARPTPAHANQRSSASLEFHQNTVGRARNLTGPSPPNAAEILSR